MEDPEFIKLRNRFLTGILICLVLFIPFFLFLYQKIYPHDTGIMKKIKREETTYILITQNDCNECKRWEESIQGKIDYSKVNKDKDSSYQRLLNQLDIEKDDIVPPALLYIKDGQLDSMVMNQKAEEMIHFLNKNMGSE
ncbi:MAG: hypothetical protein IJI60_04680 [Bacilli bacterium]|nr:hypothetical protein [Bacilli bacterium]